MTGPQHAADPDQSFSNFADFYRKSAYSVFPQDHRTGGSFGVTMMKVDQEPIDFIDAPVPDLVFCRGDTESLGVMIDCGDGPDISGRFSRGLAIYPANTANRTQVQHSHALTQLALPVASLTEEIHSAGITQDGSSFGPWLGRLRPQPLSTSRLMDRMWQVLQDPSKTDHLLLDGLTLQFLAELSGAGDLAPLGGAHPEDERIVRVIDYIEAHYGEALSIGELAAVACLSPGHFSRTFKATVGAPVWTYVTCRRCERAKEMLLTTRLPLTEIAYRCGFANQGHLTRLCNEHFGTTPGAIRQSGLS